MSSGILWWYPAIAAPIVTLSVRVARLTIAPERQGVSAQALSGAVYHTTAGQADRVSVELSPAMSLTNDDTEATIRDRLATLEDHLLRGGLCGFAAFATRAWAARLPSGMLGSPGDTGLSGANGLPTAVAGSLAAGSRVVLRDLSAIERREENTVDAVVGPAVTLVHGVTAGLAGGAVARERHTYPALRLAPDGREPMRTDPDGVVYRWSATLIEDLSTAVEVLPQPETLASRTLAGATRLGPTMATPRGLGSRSWVLP